jgi:GNAT superfamily N-acetyltransferase
MLVIRKATAADAGTILALVRALATYEREPDAVVATEEDYLRDGFGPEPAFHVLLAEDAAPAEPASPAGTASPAAPVAPTAIGFAFWFFTYSTWTGTRCLHLEDLFVRPEHRGRGAGLALMKALAREAVRANCKRFVWNVLDWNEPAIRFYERLGAKVLPDWRSVRLEAQPLAALAEAP